MALIDPKSLSVDYKKLLSVPIGDRTKLLRSGVVDQLMSALTPGQQASLFPSYYLKQMPDVGAVGGTSLYAALSGGIQSVGGVGGTATPATKTPNVETPKSPQDKALAEIYKEAGLDKPGLPVDGEIPPTYDPKLGVPTETNREQKTGWNRISGDPNSPENLQNIAPVETPYGTINVRKDAAVAFSGFYGDLHSLGFPMKNAPGSFNIRQKRSAGAGHNPGAGWSQHSYANATDIGNQTQWTEEQIKWMEENPGALERIKDKWGMRSPPKDDPHMEFMGAISPEAAEEITKSRQAQLDEKNKPSGLDAVSAPAPMFDPQSIESLDPKLKEYYGKANSIQRMKFEKAIASLGPEKVNEIMKKHETPEDVSKATAEVVAKKDEVAAPEKEVKEERAKETYTPPTEEKAEPEKTTVVPSSYKVDESAAIKAWRENNRMAGIFVSDDDVKNGMIEKMKEYGATYDPETKTLKIDDTAKLQELKNMGIDVDSILKPTTPSVTEAVAEEAPTAMATGGLKDIPPGEDKVIADAKTGNVENYINSRESVQLKVDPATLNKQEPVATFADTEKLEADNPVAEAAKSMPHRDVAKIPNLLTDISGASYPHSPSFERAMSRSNETIRNHFGDPHMVRSS